MSKRPEPRDEMRHRRLTEVMTHALTAAVNGRDQKQVFDELLRGLLEATDSEFGFIGEVFEEDGRPFLKTHAITNVAWDAETRKFYEENAPAGLEFRNLHTLFGAVLTGRKTVISNDPSNDARAGGTPAGHPELTSFLGVPFFSGDEMVGMAGIANRPGGYDDHVVEFIEEWLNNCGALVESFRHEQRRRLVEQHLVGSEARMRAVLNAATRVSIIATDLQGTITIFNTGAEAMLGYSAKEMIGLHTPELIHLESEVLARGEELSREYGRAISGFDVFVERARHGIGERRVWTYIRKDGTHLQVSLAVTAVRTSDGDITGFLGVADDITARKRAEEALRRSEERFDLAVKGSNDGLWDWDVQSNEVFYSERFRELLGYSDHEFPNVFDSFKDHLHPDDHDRVLAAVDCHLNHRSPYDVEYRLRTRAGEYRWFRARGQAIWSDAGEPLRMAGSLTDITRQKQDELGLRDATQAAEQANRAKSEFLANMSHEIRTPMHGIIGMTEVLRETGLSGQQTELVDMIASSSESLMALVNDILDVSKIEAGRLELESVEFCLRDTLAQSLQSLQFRATKKGLQLSWKVDADVPDRVVGDPVRLTQVLINLVGNAVKFTTTGSVGITAVVEDTRPGVAIVRFHVKDTGIGISESQQRVIFDVFNQGDASTTRRFGGTGLGLSISQQLVQLMGGEIGVHSIEGQGAEFFFTASLGTDGPREPAESARSQDSRPIRNRRCNVLLADDNPVNRRFAQFVLEKAGHHVTVAANGREAVEAVTNGGEFDAILMDVQMPEMDGLTATRLIAEWESPRGDRTPVIAMTAGATTTDREQCFDAGMVDYIAKPAKPAVMVETLSRVVEQGSERQTRAEVAPEPGGQFRIESALAAVEGDEELLRDLVELHLEEFPKRLSSIQTGAAARDWDLLAQSTHALKGSLAAMQIEPALESAADLEASARRRIVDDVDEQLARLERDVADANRELQRFLEQRTAPADRA